MTRKSFRKHWGGGRFFGSIFVAIVVMLAATLGLSMSVLKAEATSVTEASETADNGETEETAETPESDDGDTKATEETNGEAAESAKEVDAADDAEDAAAGGATDDAAGSSILQLLRGSGQSNGDSGDKACKKQLGALGWLICPTTGKIAEAVDWLYGRIEGVLVVNPISRKDDNKSPVYEIWKYLRGIMNIVFIIFLLVVVYSQITGMGISNYGIKQALPKLIIAAVMANLSFIICSVLVDLSNITGDSLRGLFKTIQMETFGGMGLDLEHLNLSSLYAALGGVVGLGIVGVTIAVEVGAVWMLIPVVLGAIVAVASGLITVSFRQAIVILLLMVAPLAFGANVFPNLDTWFKKWKNMLFQMLVFYPMFSLLFGASSFAGWAIIAAAGDGFGILLGVAVQIFPLFFSWSLMKMSGTALDRVSGFLRGVGDWAVAKNAGWATSHSQLTRARNLAKIDPRMPQTRLMQYLNNRRIAREIDTKELNEHISKRGADYAYGRYYKQDGSGLTERVVDVYARQRANMGYDETVQKFQNDMNAGMGVANRQLQMRTHGSVRVDELQTNLDRLDAESVVAADNLFAEKARAESIERGNAAGRQKRFADAEKAYTDRLHTHVETVTRADGTRERVLVSDEPEYAAHFKNEGDYREALNRYQTLNGIMRGDELAIQHAAGSAASAFDTQNKIFASKIQKHFEFNTEPTKDLERQLAVLTSSLDPAADIDAIIAGMRVLNDRGDTDLMGDALEAVLKKKQNAQGELVGGIQLGTHASQTLAKFLMTEVRDSDPFYRRFGKYINLETAAVYNKNERLNRELTFEEYLTGVRQEYVLDDAGHFEIDPVSGTYRTRTVAVKKPGTVLMKGTPLDGIERTAFPNFAARLQEAYTNEDGVLNVDGYLSKLNEYTDSIMPAFISSSLKLMSESEGLASEAAFLTGLTKKPRRDASGDIEMGPDGKVRYFWEKDWETVQGVSDEGRDRIKRNHREMVKKYLKAQTPAQILSLRSDYREGLMEHLIDEYLDNHGGREDYNDAIREIEERDYSDSGLSAEEANARRTEEKEALRKELFGRGLRELLDDESGKLTQIHGLVRSSVAANAKDWVRDALQMLPKKKEEGVEIDPPDDADFLDGTTLDDGFKAQLRVLYENGGLDGQQFYEGTIRELRKEFGDTAPIVAEYEKFYSESTGMSGVVPEKGHFTDALDELFRRYYGGGSG